MAKVIFNIYMDTAWKRLISAGLSEPGAAGLMGNLYAESAGFLPNRVEFLCMDQMVNFGVFDQYGNKYTDDTFTAAVDNGYIDKQQFLHPLWYSSKASTKQKNYQYGYGLAQWTSPGRKEGLYNLAKARKSSIADVNTQLDWLMMELNGNYAQVFQVLLKATGVRQASDKVLYDFESPANPSQQSATRYDYSMQIYEKFKGSTKKEVSTVSKKEKAIQWMENTAADNSHGYDQQYRWGQKGDYDCSSAVITAWENAGVPVKSKGATYTGNMKSVFLKCGFKEIPKSSVDFKTGAGLERADVLLNTSHHTAMYCGNKKEVEACINEKGKITGGKPGDQTGGEFCVQGLRDYPWNCILRYPENGSEQTEPDKYFVKYDNGTPVNSFMNWDNAVKGCDNHPGSKIYDTNGKVLYPEAEKEPEAVSGPLNETEQAVGRAVRDCDVVNIYAEGCPCIKSWPHLAAGNLVSICDTVQGYYFVRIKNSLVNVLGFVKCEDLEKV